MEWSRATVSSALCTGETAGRSIPCTVDCTTEYDMGLLWTAIVGLLTGALAKAIMPGRDPGGLIVTMLLGLSGAVLGSVVGRALGWYETGESAGLLLAIAGAVLLLTMYRSLSETRRRRQAEAAGGARPSARGGGR